MIRRKCKALRVRQAAVLFFKCDRQVYVLTITEMQGKKLDAVSKLLNGTDVWFLLVGLCGMRCVLAPGHLRKIYLNP